MILQTTVTVTTALPTSIEISKVALDARGRFTSRLWLGCEMSTGQPKITKFFVSTSPVKNCVCDDDHTAVVPNSNTTSERRSKLSLKHKRGPLNRSEPEKRLKHEPKPNQDAAGIRSGLAVLKKEFPQNADESLSESKNDCAERIALSESPGTTEVIGSAESVEPRVPYYLENLVLMLNCVRNSEDWDLFSEPEKKMFSDLLEADGVSSPHISEIHFLKAGTKNKQLKFVTQTLGGG